MHDESTSVFSVVTVLIQIWWPLLFYATICVSMKENLNKSYNYQNEPKGSV